MEESRLRSDKAKVGKHGNLLEGDPIILWRNTKELDGLLTPDNRKNGKIVEIQEAPNEEQVGLGKVP